jgi:cytochrome bd-type quinol oxidase subunit 2
VEILFKILVVLHFVGLASLLGGFLVQMSTRPRVINNAMLHGVLTQVVTGIAMVGIVSAKLLEDETVDNSKIAIKLLIALFVLGAVLLGRRKPAEEQQPYWAAAGALTLVNVIVAVFV